MKLDELNVAVVCNEKCVYKQNTSQNAPPIRRLLRCSGSRKILGRLFKSFLNVFFVFFIFHFCF